MTELELASNFRDRLIGNNLLTNEELSNISDRELIDSYITCSCCGAKKINNDDLRVAIKLANNAGQFLRIVDEFAEIRRYRFQVDNN